MIADFTSISYLKSGTLKQQRAYHLLTEHGIMEKLKPFTPVLTGTIPIEIDTEESDLDICCGWKDKAKFISCIESNFGHFPLFQILKNENHRDFPTVFAEFQLQSFQIEIFGQNRPATEQEAYRHMLIEHSILNEKGSEFKHQIIELKKQGIKTEPAFAQLLELSGDPFLELLKYEMHNLK